MRILRTHRHRALNALTIVALLASMIGGALLPAAGVDAAPSPAPVAAPVSAPLSQNAPTSATIVGSLQDELGCPGDWQPDCANTAMAYDADDDVWQYAPTIPAGDFEYKVALNGSWDENYGAGAQRDGPNIPLSLSAQETVKFYYDHKSHWVTDNQTSRIVTAPGSYQAAIGCPGDWQPGCLRSWLQDPDGDGIYTLVTDAIPAGDYEAKAAIDEGWDENYGQGGVAGGDNIAFSVPAGATVTFSFDSATNTPTISVEAGGGEDWAAIAQPPARSDFQNQVMYFVMPDRFADGDPGNNTGGIPGDRLANGYDPTDKGFYHGGDMAGLASKMDYLDGLGVTALWMTPIFKNQPVQGSGADVSAGYHGYWITDFTQVDPHFGDNNELTNLIQAATAKGVGIFFDIITNHTADVIDYQEGQYSYRSKTDYPYKDADGNVFDDRDYINSPDFPLMDAETSFPYTPVFNNAGDETLKTPAWLNDPTNYHNRGNSQFSGENSLYGDFFGLDDLFTEQPDVVQGMIDIYKQWIADYDIAGFRIDTVKHVNAEFWQPFSQAIKQQAADVGKPDFFFFGEVFSGNEQLLSFYPTSTDMSAVLDFKFQEHVRNYVSTGGSATALKDMFELDDVFTDADSNAYMLPVFTGNHDRGRFGYFLIADNGGSLSDAEMLARDKLAHAMMYFARGVPVIYYGDEQGFTGTGGDKDARQDMFPSQVAEYGDPAINKQIGVDGTPADDNFDPTHPLYQALADDAALYQANQALRTGAQIHRYAADGPGIYAFSRIDRNEKVEYVVAFNNADSQQTATFDVFSANLDYQAVHAEGVGQTLTSDGASQLTVVVPPTDFVIYKATQPLNAAAGIAAAKASATPGISITQPASGDEITLGSQNLDGNNVPDRLEIGADLDQTNVFAEVTFAVRESGATDWTVVGVDDNPPYRVFWDPGDVGEGKQFDFAAVVNDLNGGFDGATVTGVTVKHAAGGGGSAGYDYAVIHYYRSDGDYGDPTTGDYNDYWGLHLWGDAIDPSEAVEWTSPKPFLGETDYGRFAWIKLQDSSKDVNFIVHRGDVKDGTDADRAFNPNSDGPEIWLKQDDGSFYTSQAAAQGYVTIHYQRPDGLYDGWGLHLWGDAIADGVGTEWGSPRPWDGVDDFGAFWKVPIKNDAPPVNFIIHKGDDKDPGPDQAMTPSEGAHAYVLSEDETIYSQQGDAENFAIIHYRRDAGDYGDYTSADYNDFWGLHTWAAADDPGWTTPRKADGQDSFGVYYKVPLTDKNQAMGYILHRGDEKDPGPDQSLDFGKWGFEVWQLQGADPEKPYILPILTGAPVGGGDLSLAQAHWVSEDTIAWDVKYAADNVYALHYAPDGGITLENGVISGGQPLPLTYDPAGLSDAVKAKFPHLADFAAFKIGADDLAKVSEILKGQFVVSMTANNIVMDATGVQIPGVLDDLYTYDGELGVIWNGDAPTLRLWAPTAKAVRLHLFDTSTSDPAAQVLDMTAGEKGTWSISGDAAWTGKYYLYEVQVYVPSTGQVETNLVTDPYSLNLSMNSTRSQIVNLDDASLKPVGWDSLAKPALAAPEDIAIYELHIRDFSVHDESVPDEYKGTYKAFTLPDSNGMKHLKALAKAGLTHLHLLPLFDIATIDEDKSHWKTPDIPAGAAPDSTAQRDAVSAVADEDAFNWGYDPYHYTTPEGSYATDPEGTTRILEFREMVQALNQSGLRVVMDVVYNHTNASGQAEKSVLDKVVPGYYHRLDLDGKVETSTCCQNTATEHNMMEKLMIDSLVTWATAYKVNGFRFDLMGHHMKANMEHVQQALAAVDPTIYIYGEGWDFGEVQGGQRGVNATQLNMAGTGVGTFNDRLRDAVRGGGPFDGGADMIANQGFISGVYYDPNASNSGSDAEKAEMLLSADQIRVGLAGNLADYEFEDAAGDVVKGSQIDYNGSPAGYTQDPQEHIAYVSAHDNETLYDITQYKLPAATSMADRVKVQNLGIDFTVLAQGVPFFHGGVDLLRSKSLDGNSYNSGDWFNRLDFTQQDNNWGKGLPLNSAASEDVQKALLANPALAPASVDLDASAAHLQEMLRVRSSTPLFRLQTEDDVMQRVAFHNTGPDQLPGLIVMIVSDMVDGLPDLDENYELMVALFNVNDEAQQFTDPALIGAELQLHPVQQGSENPELQAATATGALSFDPATGTFTLAPRMTAVYVLPQEPTAITDDEEPDRFPGENVHLYLPVVTR